MNHLSTFSRLCTCAVLSVALSSCYPQADNPEQLRQAHEQNANMRREIASMHKLIKQAGETAPVNAETITAKEQELARTLNELKELKRKQTEAKLRVIQLQDRLDAFRTSFRMLQSETANLHKRS